MKNEKLPKEFKGKWVDALLSGKYGQAPCGLVSNGRYCCLGVAAVVSGFAADNLRYDGYVMSEKFKGKIPEVFRTNTEAQINLTLLNDDGVPFEVIAGVINEWL
jgi:hypothetical protein